MNPALNQEFRFFCEQVHPQRHSNTDKNPYCVYGTLLRVPYTQHGFLSRVACFWSCSCSQKYEILDEGRDLLYFQVLPWHFNFLRGHSLVELTEHDDSAADIIVHGMYTYMYCCIHSAHCVPLMNGHRRGTREESCKQALDSAWSMGMSRLTRVGTAEPVSRNQVLRRERGQGIICFPCSDS